MSFHLKDAPQREYSATDQDTWRRLIARQTALVWDNTATMYREGFAKLEIPTEHLPIQDVMSARLQKLSGWQLSNAQNEYLKQMDWFVHLSQRHFPVTDYIRPPEAIDFTPLPDLFHEYFGHLAWMAVPRFNVIVDRFTRKFLATPEEQDQIANQWWFTLEFGLMREDGQIKPLGAGLLSSPGEYIHAMQSTHLHRPFTLEGAARAKARPYAFHEEYFVLESFEHLEALTADW